MSSSVILASAALLAPVMLLVGMAARTVRRLLSGAKAAKAQRAEMLALPKSANLTIYAHPGAAHNIWLPVVCMGGVPLLLAHLLGSTAGMVLVSAALATFGFRQVRKDWRYVKPAGKHATVCISEHALGYRDEFRVDWNAVQDVQLVRRGGYRGGVRSWLVVQADSAERWLGPEAGNEQAYRARTRHLQEPSKPLRLVVQLDDLESWADPGTVYALAQARLERGLE